MLRIKENKQERVFKTYYKEPFTYEKLRKAINKFKKKKLYDGEWVTADLRHSFAVNFLADGGDMRELQRILGHWNSMRQGNFTEKRRRRRRRRRFLRR